MVVVQLLSSNFTFHSFSNPPEISLKIKKPIHIPHQALLVGRRQVVKPLAPTAPPAQSPSESAKPEAGPRVPATFPAASLLLVCEVTLSVTHSGTTTRNGSYVGLGWGSSYRVARRNTVGANSTADAAFNESCWAIDGAAEGAFERAKSTGCPTANFICLTGDLPSKSVLLMEEISQIKTHTLVIAGSGAASTAVAKAIRASVNCILPVVGNGSDVVVEGILMKLLSALDCRTTRLVYMPTHSPLNKRRSTSVTFPPNYLPYSTPRATCDSRTLHCLNFTHHQYIPVQRKPIAEYTTVLSKFSLQTFPSRLAEADKIDEPYRAYGRFRPAKRLIVKGGADH